MLILKCLRKLRRENFVRTFAKFSKTSGIGNIGYGDKCLIQGKKYIEFGEESWFGTGTELLVYGSKKWNTCLKIGNKVHAQCRTRITCAKGIKIGNNVLIGPDVFITDHNHGMNPETGGYGNQELLINEVVIEDGVWLGQRVCVLPGTHIGKNSIIGANSVVTHDIPAYTIAVGL